MDKLKLLKQYFGHQSFRPGQEKLVDALLSGRDVLGVMPTGAGKSVCYQLPALMLPGLTLVISPLISLMKDQVAALTESGIPAAYLNSTLDADEYREVFRRTLRGDFKLLYAAPERLETEGMLRLAEQVEISLLAVDEAHCVSQWGQDFRPSYLKIAEFTALLPKRPVMAAFTATATAEVKDDIEKMLQLQNPFRITTGFDRPNLFFDVVHPKNKDACLLQFIREREGQSGIVYCSTRKAVESVCEKLRKNGVSATRYHAGLDDAERQQNQEDFVYDRARVMAATNAFGMGIDKSNVSFVVHYNMPKNLESYYQEAGRAGRDGEKADCVLMFSPGDVQTARFLILNTEESEALSPEQQALVREKDLQRLDQMTAYCKTSRCLRGYILEYFGETAPEQCGNCGNCNADLVEEDITVPAQKILSGVARIEKRYSSGLGIAMVMKMLRGSKEQRIFQLGLDKLTTYGIMQDTDSRLLHDYIDFLTEQDYLSVSGGEYPVLRLGSRAGAVLFRGEKVQYVCRRERKIKMPASQKQEAGMSAAVPDDGLFGALKGLRTRLAAEAHVPAYIVFSNAALTDMAAKRPRTMGEFLQVSGVGDVKAARYGEVFLEEIRRWLEEQGKN